MSGDCDNYDLRASRHVEDVEWKRTQHLLADIARDGRAAFGIFTDCPHRGLNVLNELVAEARDLFIEIPDLFFELVSSFGEKICTPSPPPRPDRCEHLVAVDRGGPSGKKVFVPGLSFGGPQLVDLVLGKGLQAFEQDLGESRPVTQLQLKDFGLEFLDLPGHTATLLPPEAAPARSANGPALSRRNRTRRSMNLRHSWRGSCRLEQS